MTKAELARELQTVARYVEQATDRVATKQDEAASKALGEARRILKTLIARLASSD